jgi:hypothetical protein
MSPLTEMVLAKTQAGNVGGPSQGTRVHVRKIIVCLAWLLLLPVPNVDARPAQYTLTGNFIQSEKVVAATLLEVTRVPPRRMSGSKPKGFPDGLASYSCELKLRIHFYIKGAPAGPSDAISVMMYSHRTDCALDAVRGRGGPVAGAVWFLRQENGVYRTVVDNMTALLAIGRFPDQASGEMRALSDPRARLAFLLLHPGTVYDAPNFAESAFSLTSDVLGLCGWEIYINVLRRLYLSAGTEFRGQICLILSRGAMCVDCARKAAASLPNETRQVRYPYLSQESLAKFEKRELEWLEVTSLQELRRRSPFLDLPEIRELLVWDACTSTLHLRRKSRSLLEKFFGVSPKDLPCVPCS